MTVNLVSSSIKPRNTLAYSIFGYIHLPLHLHMSCFRIFSLDKHMGGRPTGTYTALNSMPAVAKVTLHCQNKVWPTHFDYVS